MYVAPPGPEKLTLPVSLHRGQLRDYELASLVDPVLGNYLDEGHAATRDAEQVHNVRMQAVVGSEGTRVEDDVRWADRQQSSWKGCLGSQLAPSVLFFLHKVLCSLQPRNQRHWAMEKSQMTPVTRGRS
jgi:hypothetical protein